MDYDKKTGTYTGFSLFNLSFVPCRHPSIIPSFYRLVFADKVLTSTLESPEEYALDWTTGGNSFGISNGDVLDIKHGKKEIDDSIASLIQKATGLNYEWLISGDGEEFDHYTEIYFDENKTIEEQILERLDHICIWIQSIDGRLHVLEDRIKRMDRKLAK